MLCTGQFVDCIVDGGFATAPRLGKRYLISEVVKINGTYRVRLFGYESLCDNNGIAAFKQELFRHMSGTYVFPKGSQVMVNGIVYTNTNSGAPVFRTTDGFDLKCDGTTVGLKFHAYGPGRSAPMNIDTNGRVIPIAPGSSGQPSLVVVDHGSTLTSPGRDSQGRFVNKKEPDPLDAYPRVNLPPASTNDIFIL